MTSQEILLDRLVELRRRYSDRLSESYDAGTVWFYNDPPGYSYTVIVGLPLTEANYEEIVYQANEAARIVHETAGGDTAFNRIHSAIFMTTFGSDIVGSGKATVSVTADGYEMAESVSGTVGVAFYVFQEVFRDRLTKLLNDVETGQVSVIVERIGVRSYVPKGTGPSWNSTRDREFSTVD